MIPKLQEYMNNERIPIFLRKKDTTIYYQMQIEVAREDGLCAGIYCEYDKIKSDDTEAIGYTTIKMLSRFHNIGDLTLSEFQNMTDMNIDSYYTHNQEERMRFLEVKSEKELNESFNECSIEYDIINNNYNLKLSWIYQEGRKKWRDGSDSIGKQGIFTFDEPLEFDDDVAPERLGEMILEAFNRSQKMSKIMTRGTGLPKEIDLFEGTILEVSSPKDKHFSDYDDAGVGEIYQDYAYIAREGAESSADFLLTVAPEIYEDLSCDNIRSAWIKAFGEADEIDVTEKKYGIYQYRAEFKNKKMFRIAYFKVLNDGTALECCLEITFPSKKKKLIEKLPEMFEQFALNCKIK